MKNLLKVIAVLVIFANVLYSQNQQKTILAGNLLDVAEGKIKKNVLIVIEKDKIVKITSADERDKYPNLIDLSEYTVLPGLIDCHTHLTMNSYDKSFDIWELPIASIGIIGTVNAKKTLDAGFTTVRDVWGHFYSDVALRDAINKEVIPGPRMYVSGPALSITGGHGDWENWMSPQLRLRQNPGAVADGVDEVRKEVRFHVKNRVDLIKITATGGFGSSSIPGAASYSVEEMKTAVEEAAKNGLKVAAHAHGADGIKNAVKAGVHSIEHGSLMDDEAIELMKKHNVYLVMDILAAHYDLIEAKKDYNDKKLSENNQQLYKQFTDNFLKAHNKGVKMAFGSDSGVYPHGRNAEQFELMRKAGMNPADILRTATINAAELIGIEKNTGSIEVGKWADIIAVRGNPLEDISVLEKVSFVMKGGRVFLQDLNSLKTVDSLRGDIQEMSKAAGMAETSQLKNAEKLLVPILKKNPNWGEGWIYLGRSLAAQGRYSEGAKAVEKGGNLGERRTSVWLEACSMALKSGNEQLALTYLKRGLRENIHRPWLIQTSSFDGFLDLGDFLDTDAARKLLLQASKKRPSLHPDLIALDRKFLAQRKTLEPEQIQMMVEKYINTIANLPEDGELYYRLGKTHVKFGNYKDALVSFQRSKDLNYLPVYNDGWLAHVNAQLGNKNAAFAHLERNLAVMDTPDWIFNPGEFEPLQDDPRWKEIVDKYRPTNTTAVQIPAKDQGSVPYPTKKWSRTDPANVGINENSLLETAGTIESSFPNVASLLVVKNGQLVFEQYFNGYTDQDAFNMKSATKSFTSTAAGIMHDQGVLPDLNTPIAKILPEYFNDIDDPLKHQITVKNLLTMTAGLDWVEGEEKAENLFLTGNYAELILKEKQLHKPGESYEYSSAVSHLLAVSLTKLSGQDLLSYTQGNLFDPLGITPEVWAQDLNGYYLGDGELRLRPQDLARFGLLILRGGKWDGKSVVSTEWVRNATAIQVPEARGPHTSYGFQFWVINVGGHRVIKAAGYGGQRCWIIPSLDMVVVITSEPLTPDNDPDAILGQWIIPSVERSEDEKVKVFDK